MRYREIGKTGLRLSVVGLGSAQLQMLPEAQAVATLAEGFRHGVNWVHSAPDYGSVERWIQRAIVAAGVPVSVAATGTADAGAFGTCFDATCHWFERDRLDLFGINCIDDIERMGGNVWGAGGMVAQLEALKASGRLRAAFCTTHGSADYSARLVTSGVFDAIMLAYNPLGFHLLTYDATRDQRVFEDLAETRRRVFPLAASRSVSLLVMKVLAGGLLTRGQAFEPRAWLGPDGPGVDAQDVIRLVLAEPGVTAVVTGVGSPEEARANAIAGAESVPVPEAVRRAVTDHVQQARLSWCSRCGKCEPTCSRGLPVSSMFRDAYIWTTANEHFMADERENYFHLHPDTSLACATCDNRTCECPQGLDVPLSLARVHGLVHQLRDAGLHPGPAEARLSRVTGHRYPVTVLTAEAPASAVAGAEVTLRFLLQHGGTNVWFAQDHLGQRDGATGVSCRVGSAALVRIPVRQNLSPGERGTVAVTVRMPDDPGPVDVVCAFTSLTGEDTEPAFWHGSMFVTARPPEYAAQIVEHTMPATSAPGHVWGVRVTVENQGALTWCADDPEGHRVDLVLRVDGTVVTTAPLPKVRVSHGDQVSVHFAWHAPREAGTYAIRVELVHQHVAWFADRGVPPGDLTVVVTGPSDTSTTAVAYQRAIQRNIWHYQPTSGIHRSRDGRVFPQFVSRALGTRVWDPEGHEWLDYTMGWGSTILGYDDPRIRAAAAAVSPGVTAMPHPLEMEVSEWIAEDFPSVEMLVFGKNGSDACTVAARLARLDTRRRVILSCGFHGWQDFGLDPFPFEASGIPRGDRSLFKFHFNDREGFLELFMRHRDDLAAIMIEPSGPMGGNELGPMPDTDPAFLHLVAEAAADAGARLIFDEIITGYRYPDHSVQKAHGVTPDLTCLGKALASGYPLSVVGGAAPLLLSHFSSTHYCPTFKAEAAALAAAHAAIRIYRAEPVGDRLWAHGRALMTMLDDLCRQYGVAASCQGPPFRFALWFAGGGPYGRRVRRTFLMQEWLKARICTVSGVMLPSAAHTADDVETVRTATAPILERIARARSADELARLVELPLL